MSLNLLTKMFRFHLRRSLSIQFSCAKYNMSYTYKFNITRELPKRSSSELLWWIYFVLSTPGFQFQNHRKKGQKLAIYGRTKTRYLKKESQVFLQTCGYFMFYKLRFLGFSCIIIGLIKQNINTLIEGKIRTWDLHDKECYNHISQQFPLLGG